MFTPDLSQLRLEVATQLRDGIAAARQMSFQLQLVAELHAKLADAVEADQQATAAVLLEAQTMVPLFTQRIQAAERALYDPLYDPLLTGPDGAGPARPGAA